MYIIYIYISYINTYTKRISAVAMAACSPSRREDRELSTASRMELCLAALLEALVSVVGGCEDF